MIAEVDGVRENWVEYEKTISALCLRLDDYGNVRVKKKYEQFPDCNLILFGHPLYEWQDNTRLTLKTSQEIIDGEKYLFYIDSSEVFEWASLNALYKNSYLSIDWFRDGERMRQDPDIHKISLKNVIRGKDDFFEEFEKVCGIIEHKLTQEERIAVSQLYDQWKKTTLSEDRFEEFKSRYGIRW
jgi:hypothetical protein